MSETDIAGERVASCSLCTERIGIDTDNYVNFGNCELSPGLYVAEVCADCVIRLAEVVAKVAPDMLVRSRD